MHRIVSVSFKAIFFAIIFVVVWDVGFYLMRAQALDNKIESLLVSMRSEVSKNNYLPADSYTMYENILKGIAKDMNGSGSNKFVLGYHINYNRDCFTDVSGISGINFSKRLNTPANYGDVAIIELSVTVNAVNWYYDRSQDGAANEVQNRLIENKFTYLYQVPCLRYISVTN